MQVGRVVFILSEDESNQLLTVLDRVAQGDYDIQNKENVNYLRDSLCNAKKTIFVDDYRPERIDILPE